MNVSSNFPKQKGANMSHSVESTKVEDHNALSVSAKNQINERAEPPLRSFPEKLTMGLDTKAKNMEINHEENWFKLMDRVFATDDGYSSSRYPSMFSTFFYDIQLCVSLSGSRKSNSRIPFSIRGRPQTQQK
jgi:hypothetical protein